MFHCNSMEGGEIGDASTRDPHAGRRLKADPLTAWLDFLPARLPLALPSSLSPTAHVWSFPRASNILEAITSDGFTHLRVDSSASPCGMGSLHTWLQLTPCKKSNCLRGLVENTLISTKKLKSKDPTSTQLPKGPGTKRFTFWGHDQIWTNMGQPKGHFRPIRFEEMRVAVQWLDFNH